MYIICIIIYTYIHIHMCVCVFYIRHIHVFLYMFHIFTYMFACLSLQANSNNTNIMFVFAISFFVCLVFLRFCLRECIWPDALLPYKHMFILVSVILAFCMEIMISKSRCVFVFTSYFFNSYHIENCSKFSSVILSSAKKYFVLLLLWWSF